MNNYYFTFGSDERYPFQYGYVIIKANNIKEACNKFKHNFPNRKGSNCLNCAFYYNENEFMEHWNTVWIKEKCHKIIE